MKIIVVVLVILITIFLGCDSNSQQARDGIAIVGERTIDWQHLQRSFELDPKWGRGLTFEEAYQNQLDYLIDQKLFASAAISERLQKDSVLAAYLNFVHEKEMIKELYRRKVESKVTVSEAEYQNAYRNMKRKVKLNYIQTYDLKSAKSYAQQLRNTEFSELRLNNPENESKGTTSLLSFGDIQAQVERVAFNMELGEVSDPIQVNDGYMVIQLAYGEMDKFMSKVDFAEKKSKIKKVVYERKANKVANRYVKDLMLDKNLQLNPQVFHALSEQLSRIVKNKYSENPSPIYLSDQEIQHVRTTLSDLLNEVLITHQSGEMKVKEFLGTLKRMPADLRPNVKTAKQLKDAIGVSIRNQYLVKEAIKLGLGESDRVLWETRAMSDEILAIQWLKKKKEQISVTEQDIAEFRTTDKYAVIKKRMMDTPTTVQLKELITDIKFAKLKLQLADSLRDEYVVKVDSTQLYKKIDNKDKIISYNPVNVVTRELFY